MLIMQFSAQLNAGGGGYYDWGILPVFFEALRRMYEWMKHSLLSYQ